MLIFAFEYVNLGLIEPTKLIPILPQLLLTPNTLLALHNLIHTTLITLSIVAHIEAKIINLVHTNLNGRLTTFLNIFV